MAGGGVSPSANIAQKGRVAEEAEAPSSSCGPESSAGRPERKSGMDLSGVMQSLRDQGPAYWVAASSVALGATLLVTAGLLQWRRFRVRVPLRRSCPVPRLTAAAAGYAARTIDSPPAVSSALDPALAARLAAAADRLAAVRADLSRWERLPDGSDLKVPVSHVEYVFRSGEA